MALAKFTLTIYEGSKTRTVIINQPSSSNLISLDYTDENSDLYIYFLYQGRVKVSFQSDALRATFGTALIAGFEAGVTFALDNRGPVATTTTTTLAP